MSRPKKKTGFQRIRTGYVKSAHRQPVKIAYLLVFVAVFAWLGHFVFPSHAATYPYQNTTASGNDLGRINDYRTTNGWKSLNSSACLNTIANIWAKSEAKRNNIEDPPVTTTTVTAYGETFGLVHDFNKYCNTASSPKYWLALGANDGEGGNDSLIFSAFLNSCPHLQNIADHGTNSVTVAKPGGGSCSFKGVTYNHVGVAAWEGSDGFLRVCEIYARW